MLESARLIAPCAHVKPPPVGARWVIRHNVFAMATTTPIPINRCEFTLEEVVAATGGTFVGGASSASDGDRALGVSIDTRSIYPGALFVALHGTASDGHDYLPQAAARGVRAAIVATGRRHPALDCIEVDDTCLLYTSPSPRDA